MARCLGIVRSPLTPEGRDPCPYDALWGDWCYWHQKIRERLIRDYPVGKELRAVAGAGGPADAKEEDQRSLLERMLAEFDA